MYQEDYFVHLAEDFPSLCSPEKIAALKQRLSVGREYSPMRVHLSLDLENVAPSAHKPLTAEQSAKKAKINKSKKMRKLANRSLRANGEAGRTVFIDNEGGNCDEAVLDALGILQDDNELDDKTYKRLSVEKFTTASLRRLSECNLEVLPAEELEDQVDGATEHIDVIWALRNYIALMELAVEAQDLSIREQSAEVDVVAVEETVASSVDVNTPIVEGAEPMVVTGYCHWREIMNEVHAAEALDRPMVDVSITDDSLTLEDVRTALMAGDASIRITDRVIAATHVDYIIELNVIVGGTQSMKMRTCQVLDRYSALSALNGRLRVAGCVVNSFPPRQWFWESKTQVSFIDVRQKQLEEWLTAVCATLKEGCNAASAKVLSEFFCSKQ